MFYIAWIWKWQDRQEEKEKASSTQFTDSRRKFAWINKAETHFTIKYFKCLKCRRDRLRSVWQTCLSVATATTVFPVCFIFESWPGRMTTFDCQAPFVKFNTPWKWIASSPSTKFLACYLLFIFLSNWLTVGLRVISATALLWPCQKNLTTG